MALHIPTRYITVMNKIVSLPDAAVDELVNALESSSITSKPEELAALIADRVPSIPKDDLSGIVDVAYALYHVREFSELNPSSFLNELVEGVRQQAKPEIPDNGVSLLRERFRRLLRIKTLETISKALKLQRDGERIYCEAKIVSDIRPVFSDDVTAKPLAAVITHTLEVAYHENGEHEEFFIVLDQEDLDALDEVIERAKAKHETLVKFLAESHLPRLGV